VFKLYT